jgi:biopolymer transport protein ExbD
MASSVDSADGEIGFQIAPMVDVVFVLMLFFMAIVGAQVMTKELSVSVPHGGAGNVPAIVEIASDGTVSFNGELIGQSHDTQLFGLRDKFRFILREFGTKDPVMLQPEATVPHERVMEVLNAIQAAGVEKVGFL